MNKAKKVLSVFEQGDPLSHAKGKVGYLNDEAKRTLENTDIDTILSFLASIADTRAGDTKGTEPEISKKWMETSKLLKDLIPKLPIAHR